MTDEGFGSTELEQVEDRQRAWARRHGYGVDLSERRLLAAEHALRAGVLREETHRELAAGDGNELQRLDHLRSSACLAVNVFEPWRDRPAPLADALGVDAVPRGLVFEAKQPTGLRGVPPNVDVLLTGDGPAIGIECKFLEMYTPATNGFATSYFTRDGLWGPLLRCRELAEAIARDSEHFRYLSAAQLLKHTLGLSKNQHDGFNLRLVWFRVDGGTADQIDAEIARFAAWLGDEIDFGAVTYQALVSSLRSHPEPDDGYFAYLSDRYGL